MWHRARVCRLERKASISIVSHRGPLSTTRSRSRRQCWGGESFPPLSLSRAGKSGSIERVADCVSTINVVLLGICSETAPGVPLCCWPDRQCRTRRDDCLRSHSRSAHPCLALHVAGERQLPAAVAGRVKVVYGCEGGGDSEADVPWLYWVFASRCLLVM